MFALSDLGPARVSFGLAPTCGSGKSHYIGSLGLGGYIIVCFVCVVLFFCFIYCYVFRFVGFSMFLLFTFLYCSLFCMFVCFVFFDFPLFCIFLCFACLMFCSFDFLYVF